MTRFAMDSTEARAREDAFLGPPTPLSNDEIHAALVQALSRDHADARVVVSDNNGDMRIGGEAYVCIFCDRTRFTVGLMGDWFHRTEDGASQARAWAAHLDRYTLRRTRGGHWSTCGRRYRTKALARASHGF